MLEKFPKVFIIVLNYNGKDVIKNCLSSVFKLDYPNFEVIVVDNNSKDGSLEAAKTNFSKAHFIKNSENLGFSAGNNVGIKFALERMADYVMILNNDIEVEKDFLGKLIEAGEKNEKIGIISPVIFKKDKSQIWFSGGEIDWSRMKTTHSQTPRTEEVYETGYLSGCAMLIKAKVFKEIGLFDEDYFLYYEDADFSWRSKRAGFKNVVVSSSWIYHFEKSEELGPQKIYWLVVSGLIFFKKNTPNIRRPWIKFYILGRKLKNFWDVILKKDEISRKVKEAYKDFKKAKI